MDMSALASQAGMEAAMRDYVDVINTQQNTFNKMLTPALLECSYEDKTVTFSFAVEPWMSNPQGIVHGGITASVLDFAMGFLCRYCSDGNMTPTVDMQIAYLRPIPLEGHIAVKARCVMSGRTIARTTAEAWSDARPGKICATASGTYFTKAGR
mgnify:CR=1 FL=1